MSLSNVENILHAVEQSLKMCPRNAYEAQNRYERNTQSLSTARATLREFSGSRIEEIAMKLAGLEIAVEKEKDRCMQIAVASRNAFSFNFDDSEAQDGGDVEDEIAQAEAALKLKAKKKASKGENGKKSKSSKKPSPPQVNPLGEIGATTPSSVEVAVEEIPPSTTTTSGVDGGSSKGEVVSRSVVEIARRDDCREVGMPPCALGYQRCEPLPNSALAAVYYAGEVEYEGYTCCCRIELYRGVLLALWGGKPVVEDALPPTAGVNEMGMNDLGRHAMKNQRASPEELNLDPLEDPSNDDETDGVSYLSSKLVNDYEAAEIAREKAEADANFPRNISPQLASRLRRFPDLIWVILICHGGYFAGGVFVEGRCVLHKAFQRYVVRKKQGGKQSTNAKDGSGSYHSAGSMIRAAQELEWKVDVRDIILAWQPYIDRASVILHAAPGPQNLAILTDFSSLPPPAAGVVKPSPISAKDPRVQRVPITTHRPKFEEVQRIYDIVSQYNVVYVMQE
ncbi:unnamed protein product [Phytomonas sp. EM1]|nr:unnamed protein product [Phytomonas sp. EM1]|eukprot:CCW64402.1 unnamed protein product [Phytomonas sp. isolate EM1]